jgi:cellulose synthase operon protein YhjQ
MEKYLTDPTDETIVETPEDVAILYSWANLHGARYRDFSASRREYRAQVRHRAAEDLRQSELAAQAEAEAAAAEAESKAREAERIARSADRSESPFERERALREAQEAARRAAAERVEAARRAEAAAIAEAAARREEREIAEAHASAQRQTQRWNDSDIRIRGYSNSGSYSSQPVGLTSRQFDPYESSQGDTVDAALPTPNLALGESHPDLYRAEAARESLLRPDNRGEVDARVEREAQRIFRQPEPTVRQPKGFRPDQPSGVRMSFRPVSRDSSPSNRARGNSGFLSVVPRMESFAPVQQSPAQGSSRTDFIPPAQQVPFPVSSEIPAQPSQYRPEPISMPTPLPQSVSQAPDRPWSIPAEPPAPAWLSGSSSPTPISSQSASAQFRAAAAATAVTTAATTVAPIAAVASDTLQSSRELVASRWHALKGVFDTPEPIVEPPQFEATVLVPTLAVFSLAGGVGKTSMVATLGRALASLGEKVLLADTTAHGLLPYYFGATELKPTVVRTFSPPAGSSDAPISLVSYEVEKYGHAAESKEKLTEEVILATADSQRLLIDFNSASGWLIRSLHNLPVTILIPVAPDMNSVIGLQAIERYFQGAIDHNGQQVLPHYLINQFDAALPLHLDVREVLRKQLGDRLLPYVIRRSPSVSEALAEGMTVVDYQPDGPTTEDYLNVANWLRGISPPAQLAVRTNRWSER